MNTTTENTSKLSKADPEFLLQCLISFLETHSMTTSEFRVQSPSAKWIVAFIRDEYEEEVNDECH